MSDVFISYSRDDKSVASTLSEALEEKGFSVFKGDKIVAGVGFVDQIERALNEAKAVVVLWTPASTNNEWVREEASYARDQNKLLPLLMVPNGHVPPSLLNRHGVKLRNSTSGELDPSSIEKLASAIRNMMAR